VVARVALCALCRQHQRRAQATPERSTNTTSPGSGATGSAAPRSVNRSVPVANRTVMPPSIPARSTTATGSAYRIDTRLPRSTSVLIDGMSPCLASRRSSDSAALRYWVGFAPNAANARRQAAIDGSPAGGVVARRSATSFWAAR
jgi:hypothetical protein